MINELDDDIFAQVIRFAPLIAIDLIIRNHEQNVLVGLRTNEPAKGFYFVPGGRIRKDERLRDAFKRIAETEVGRSVSFEDASLLGVYEHLYPNNRFGHAEYGTHYVVLAYEIHLKNEMSIKSDGQHSSFTWMTAKQISGSPQVHPYTKAYFGSHTLDRA